MEDKYLNQIFRRLKIGIVGLVLLAGTMIMVIIKLSTPQQQPVPDTPKKKAEFKAQTIAQILSTVAISPLLEDDGLALTEMVASVKNKTNEVTFASILKPDGEVLAHTDFDRIGTIETIKKGISEDETLYLFTSPIKLSEETIAYLSLGLSKSSFPVEIVRPKGFSGKMVLPIFCIFGGVLCLFLLFTTHLQRSVSAFFKNRLEAKEARIRHLVLEKAKLQELAEKKIQKPAPEPLITNQAAAVAVDKLLADFVEKEEKTAISQEPVEQKAIFKTDELEKAVKEIEKLFEEFEEPRAMVKESKREKVIEEPIVIENRVSEYEPVELGELSLTMVSPTIQNGVTKRENNHELKKLGQTDGISITSIAPLPYVLGKLLEIKFSLLNETPLLVIIDSPKGELIRLFNITGKKGENLFTWDGKSLLGSW